MAVSAVNAHQGVENTNVATNGRGWGGGTGRDASLLISLKTKEASFVEDGELLQPSEHQHHLQLLLL